MKTFIAFVCASMMVLGITTTAMAASNPADAAPVRMALTVHQQMLMNQATQKGVDRVVLPLTFNQESFLSSQWMGWSSSVLTVYVADMFEHNGSVYVIPE